MILDGGTTALAVARALPQDLACTVITHSPTIVTALLDHQRAELFLLGGRIFKHSAVACGAAAVEAAQNVSADLCLLGVTGVHPDAGLTTADAEEAAMKRALSARAAETYVLASAEKIGTASRFRVLPWEKVGGLITDADAHDPVLGQLTALGVEILTAAWPVTGPRLPARPGPVPTERRGRLVSPPSSRRPSPGDAVRRLPPAAGPAAHHPPG